ncbi:hypothetical protein B0H11DRAFT_1915552 [Mycena galericulata]|nr:hypothetical protein B0H11DRAFT_1915552 [Mycena galericulata]
MDTTTCGCIHPLVFYVGASTCISDNGVDASTPLFGSSLIFNAKSNVLKSTYHIGTAAVMVICLQKNGIWYKYIELSNKKLLMCDPWWQHLPASAAVTGRPEESAFQAQGFHRGNGQLGGGQDRVEAAVLALRCFAGGRGSWYTHKKVFYLGKIPRAQWHYGLPLFAQKKKTDGTPAVALKLMAVCIAIAAHIEMQLMPVSFKSPYLVKSAGSGKMTLVALDEFYNLGIGINGLGNIFPFWDTNAFCPKREFSTLGLPWLIFQSFLMI